MLYKSSLLAEASGSVDGLVFSHNRGGRYIRRRTIPTNPNSSMQQVTRAAFAAAMARWRDVATAIQRAAWKVYAANTPMVNALGETIYLTGPQMYCRTNSVAIQRSITPFDDAPTTFGLPELSPLTIAAAAPAANVTLNFNVNDDWVGVTGTYLFAFFHQPENPTIDFCKGPFRICDATQGNTGSPPTSPDTLGQGFWVFTAGQKLFGRFILLDEQGRLSVPQIVSCLVT
jgi:hypothetical protein